MINSHYIVCKQCVMDNTDIGISFDEDGVCDHCKDFENTMKLNSNIVNRNKKNLEEIIQKIKVDGKDKNFDCILGLSGGLDSSYLLHLAVKEFGLRPLVFHVDGGWNTEAAVHNINVMINKLELDLYTEVINWEEMKDFQLAFFKSGVPHLDIPQDHAFIATLYHFAYKNDIKYILNGGNISTEGVQYPMLWFYYGTDMLHINDIREKFGISKMDSYPFSSIYWHKIYLRYIKGIRVVKLLNDINYIKSDAVSLLEKEYNWKSFTQKHFESRFTKFLEGYWLPMRFGFDTRKAQYSSLILTGQMTRDEAIERLKIPAYDPATIEDEFNYIATKLGIKSEELRHYFTMPKKYYWNYKNQQNIFRFGAKVLHLLDIEKVKKRKE